MYSSSERVLQVSCAQTHSISQASRFALSTRGEPTAMNSLLAQIEITFTQTAWSRSWTSRWVPASHDRDIAGMRARILHDAIHSIFLQSYGLAEKLLNKAHHLWKSVHFPVRCTHYVVSLTIFTGVLQPDTGRFDQGRTTSADYTGGYDLIISSVFI